MLNACIASSEVHTDDDDPCVPIVRTGLVRMAELMGEDFLPHTQLVIPQLLRLANTQAEHTLQEGLNADMDDSNQWRTSVTAAGGLVKVNTETVREKEQAIMLLYALANSLGSGLMEVGDDETTTGDWTAYAEAMLETAKVHLEYDHSGDVRQAASLLLPAPVKSGCGSFIVCWGALSRLGQPLTEGDMVASPTRLPRHKGIKSSTRYSEEYNLRLIGGTVPSLIAALTYENESEPLAALFRAASDVVLAVPEVFSQSDAECFVKAMRDQIEELQVYTSDLRTRSPPDLVTLQLAQEDAVWTLQSMTTTLACFLSVMGSDFPIQPLFNVFNQAVYGQLGVDGEREWAFRLIADLVKYASPAAMAWTAGFLPLVTDTLTSSSESSVGDCSDLRRSNDTDPFRIAQTQNSGGSLHIQQVSLHRTKMACTHPSTEVRPFESGDDEDERVTDRLTKIRLALPAPRLVPNSLPTSHTEAQRGSGRARGLRSRQRHIRR